MNHLLLSWGPCSKEKGLAILCGQCQWLGVREGTSQEHEFITWYNCCTWQMAWTSLAKWWWKIFRAKAIRRQSTNTPKYKLDKAWSAAVCLPLVLVTRINDSRKTHRRSHVIQTSNWMLFVWSSYRYFENWTHSVSCKTQSWSQRQSWLLVSGTRSITDSLLGLLLFSLFLIFCYRAFIFPGGHPFILAWSLITSRFH